MKFPGLAFAAPLLMGLAGCKMVVLRPAGDIAMQQSNLVLLETGLLLIVIAPVIACILFFAWKYRASNLGARYAPDWHHSTRLMLMVWAVPLLIVLSLGSLIWVTSHTLDPYRPLTRLEAGRPIPPGTKSLRVEVVALDWKWLFIYPDLGVATVNELAAPIDTPIDFKITASSVMNSFYIPAMAGQIYAMPGMQTQLHGVINKPGAYEGFSANYSGAGFSGMHFKVEGLPRADFDRWVAGARAAPAQLTRANYQVLARPSSDEPARLYGRVDPDLFPAVVAQCAAPGSDCMAGMEGMMHPAAAKTDDAICRGGAGARLRLAENRTAAPQPDR